MEKIKKQTGNIKGPSPSPKAAPAAAPKPAVAVKKTADFAFSKENYRWMLIGLGFIVVGFILMIGGGARNPNDFNPEIFSFQRLTLAPILILTGYVIEIFAILKKPRD